MRTLTIIVLAAALSACGSTIDYADEDRVSIRFHNYSESPMTLQPVADEHCASYNRTAVYQSTTFGDGIIGFLTGLPLHAEYECRA